jgi:hypothetical protein
MLLIFWDAADSVTVARRKKAASREAQLSRSAEMQGISPSQPI